MARAEESELLEFPLLVNVNGTKVTYETATVWNFGDPVEPQDWTTLPAVVKTAYDRCVAGINLEDKLAWEDVESIFQPTNAGGGEDPDLGSFLTTFDAAALKGAFDLLNVDYIPWVSEGSPSEKFLEQHVYPAIYRLLLAAAEGAAHGYRATEVVAVGNVKKSDGEGGCFWAVLSALPDVALLWKPHLPIFVAELKAGDSSTEDMLKCVVYAVFTVLLLAKHQVFDVPIPFFTTGGPEARLYVATYDQQSAVPRVSEIKPTSGASYLMTDRRARLELAIKVFVLLGHAMKRLRGITLSVAFKRKKPNVINDPSQQTGKSPPSGKSPPTPNETSSNKRKPAEGHKGSSKRGPTVSEAMGAASLDGRITSLRNTVPVNAIAESSEQRARHHYFRGVDRTDGTDVFVKVKAVFDHAAGGDDETEMQRRAQEGTVGRCRIPRVVHHILTSKFRVIAMEWVQDKIVDVGSIFAYAVSLLDGVDALHRSGILHGDIKPANVLWNGTAVVLVDFGHAQLIDGARPYNGTKGFTAPEVAVDKKPHSMASDAFSVGKTLEEVVAETGPQGDATLAAIIAGLTKADVAERLTLSDALEKLETSSPSSKRHRPAIPEVTP